MAATAEELKELAGLYRKKGDKAGEAETLESLIALKSSQPEPLQADPAQVQRDASAMANHCLLYTSPSPRDS